MKKTLYRSRTDKKVSGVCGGLAEYTGIDATIWRIIFLLFVLPGGPSIFIYLILWVLIPLEPQAPKH